MKNVKAVPTLSEADLTKAKERYAEALGKNTENAEGLDLFKFKGAVIVLCLSENLTLPSEKDLNMAFETADLDKSGFVDEAEFIELYAHVKEGNVKGLSKKSLMGKKKKSIAITTSESRTDLSDSQHKTEGNEASAKSTVAPENATEEKVVSAAQEKPTDEEKEKEAAAEMVASIEEKVVSKGMSPILRVIVDLLLALVIILLAAAAFRAYAASELPVEEEIIPIVTEAGKRLWRSLEAERAGDTIEKSYTKRQGAVVASSSSCHTEITTAEA